MSVKEDNQYLGLYLAHIWPWEQTLLEQRQELQAYLGNTIKPHVDRRNTIVAAWHDITDGKEPGPKEYSSHRV
jgi:hypothetical protein